MTQEEILATVPGAQTVVDWFGTWPMFHDAEVLSVSLHRSSTSTMEVHGFWMTGEVDERGYYKLVKHAVVRFLMKDVVDCSLTARTFSLASVSQWRTKLSL